jgi:hypothetical protein
MEPMGTVASEEEEEVFGSIDEEGVIQEVQR